MLAKGAISIVDMNDGVNGTNGKTYVLNIINGVRTITYNSSGTTPVPTQTAFSCELYENGVLVTPTYAWTSSGHLSGTSNIATFTPVARASHSTSLGVSDFVALTVTYAGQTLKAVAPIVVIRTATNGTPAKLVTLIPSGQTFKQDAQGAILPATITVTGSVQNTTITTWTYSVDGGAFSSTVPTGLALVGSVATITGTTMTAKSISVKATDGTYTDVITIVKVADGVKGTDGTIGSNGQNAITGYLTNESITFSTPSSGAVSGVPMTIGTFEVYDGITKVTGASVTYSKISNTGCIASIASTGVITLTSMDNDTATILLTATYNTVVITKTVSLAKSKSGIDGIDIVSVDVWYYLSTSATSLLGGTWSTTAPAWVNGKYMWSKTITTYSTGSPTESTPVCITGAIGSNGSDGTDGKGITSTVVTYQAHTSGTVTPTGIWTASVPVVADGSFLWTRTIITYTDASTVTGYSVGKMGVQGNTGLTGKGISSTVVTYQVGTSGTTAPTGTWLATIPSVPANQYLWTRIIITYTDATTTTSYAIGLMGAQGAKGDTGNTGATGVSIISVTEYYLATTLSTGVTTATAGWTTAIQTITSTNKYLWNYEVVNFSNSTSAPATTPVIIGTFGDTGGTGATGRALNSVTEYYLASASATGVTRATAGWTTTMQTTTTALPYLWNYETLTWSVAPLTTYVEPIVIAIHGATGTGITSITEESSISTSKTVAPTQGWDTTVKIWSTGNYIWTRSKIVYSNPTSTVYTTPIVDSSWEAVNEVKVGGRNLLLNSDVAVTNTSYPTQTYNMSEKMVLNTQYTIRLWGTLGAGKTSFTPYLNGGSISLGAMINNNDGTFSLTFLGKDSGVTTGDSIHVYPVPSSTVIGSTITKIKLETGNKATDWTPSLEDTNALIGGKADNDAVNAIADAVDALTGSVGAKADAGVLDTLKLAYEAKVLADAAEKVVAEGKLSALDGRVVGINNILDDKVVKWTFIENSITAGEEGVFIGDTVANMGILISVDPTTKEGRISFLDKGTEVAYISNKTMQITHGIFVLSAIIGKHKIETLPSTDITVFTYVG